MQKQVRFAILSVISLLLFFVTGSYKNIDAASCTGTYHCMSKDVSTGQCNNIELGGGICDGNTTQNSCNSFHPCNLYPECMQGGCSWDVNGTPPPTCTDSSTCDTGEMCCDGLCQSEEGGCDNSCHVNGPTGLSATRISSSLTSENWQLSWTLSTSTNDKQPVKYQILKLDTLDRCTDCQINVQLPATQNTYVAYNLIPGARYYWSIIAHKSGCHGTNNDDFMSCDVFDNPTYLNVGETKTMTSTLKLRSDHPSLHVTFSTNNNTVSLSPLKSTSYPFQTNVYGESNNIGETTTVTGSVYTGNNYQDNNLWCQASADVVVGATPTPTSSPTPIPATPTPNPSNSTCSISVDPVHTVAGVGETATVTYLGTVSPAVTGSADVRLWLERRIKDQPVTNGVVSPLLETYSGSYYKIGECSADPGGTCGGSVSLSAPPGEYYIHCDVPYQNGLQ